MIVLLVVVGLVLVAGVAGAVARRVRRDRQEELTRWLGGPRGSWS